MERWEYRNLQLKTTQSFSGWGKLEDDALAELEKLQDDGWEVYHTADIKGSMGFTAHVLFMLRRRVR